MTVPVCSAVVNFTILRRYVYIQYVINSVSNSFLPGTQKKYRFDKPSF